MTAFAYANRIRASSDDRWRLVYASNALLTVILAMMVWRTAPNARLLSLTVLVLSCVAVLAKPMLGVYIIAFFSILSDSLIAGWFPFVKNFSSYESVLYVHNAMIFSPLDLMLVLTIVAWWLHAFGGRSIPVVRKGLYRPVTAFGIIVLGALLYGLVRGGDLNIALWEVRPLLYVPLTYILASSLVTTEEHFHRLITTVVVALLLEAIHAQYVIGTYTESSRWGAGIMGFLEHSASLHFNSVLVILLAAWLFRARCLVWRFILPVAIAAILPVYILAERRSAVVALIAATSLFAVILFRKRRTEFWIVVPATLLISVAYLIAYWDVEGGVGFPAQAVKSVFAPEQLSVADQNSDLYRRTETNNLVATIRANPITGTGFGHPFLRVYDLPYIPFIWAEYIPHNSLLWIWINTGIAGFIAMLWMFSTAVIRGVRAALRLDGRAAALALSSTLFLIMFVVFAYVDIAWDAQTAVYLGVCMATVNFFGTVKVSTLDDDVSSSRCDLFDPAAGDAAPRGA